MKSQIAVAPGMGAGASGPWAQQTRGARVPGDDEEGGERPEERRSEGQH